MADIEYTRKFGDRKEGRLLRSLSPFYNFIPYIMITRNDASNHFEDKVEISEAERWFREKRTEGFKGMGMLHLFIAAYCRTCALYPGLNRFIAGRRIYARNNIEIVLTVKREMKVDADETTIKVIIDPTDTIFDVYRKLGEKVDEIKANDGDNNTEQIAGLLCKLPRPILKFAIGVIKILDYFGILPQAVMDASPFHGSMIITDLGSLGIPPIYHHLYNFGTLPTFIAFGGKRRAYEVDMHGNVLEKKYVDYKCVLDERTVDGLYYANAFRQMKHFLKNPSLLEQPLENPKSDVL